MKKHILKYLAFSTVMVLLLGCNDSENKLLETKVYFENKEMRLEVEDQQTMDVDISSRLSMKTSSDVQVSYAIADKSIVESYNHRNGTNYMAFDGADLTMSENSTTIPAGQLYSEKNVVQLKNLDKVEDGKSYLVAIQITSASLPVIKGQDTFYIVISKPTRIMKVGRFNSNAIKVPLLPGKPFQSVTYESLVYIDRFGDNNTIMGCEGILILRIGDQALPGRANNMIQIAGNKQFHADHKFVANKWYHVAFTYDQPSGKAVIYIDGEKAAESSWDTPSFDLTGDGGGFFVGKVAGFMWGERPLYGKMSEVRLWNVARTENQIRQSMLDVDPKSEGLVAYYKLNGLDQYKEGSTYYVKDASDTNMNGLANVGRSAIETFELEEPISIK